MEPLYLVVLLFATVILLLNSFSRLLQRLSLPAPTLALLAGLLLGPHALGVLDLRLMTPDPQRLLEEVARFTLAVGLVGVALRLPHGYWRKNRRWILGAIGIGMPVMFLTATAVLALGTGLPILLALLIAAIITPTDPIVTTPIVTGSVAEEHVPERVRFNLSAESGLNDGLGVLFVMLAVLSITRPAGDAWLELLTRVLLWEVLGGAAIGLVAGFGLGRLFNYTKKQGLMEETSALGFVLALALVVLGASRVLAVDAVLAVFVAAAVFGQVVPRSEAKREDRIDDTVNRFVALPAFLLLGLSLPVDRWLRDGPWVAIVVLAALLLRRFVGIWVARPVFAPLHSRSETLFLSWFAPVGISALLYATIAERHTGDPRIFPLATLAITISVFVHGLSSMPWSTWLQRRAEAAAEQNRVSGTNDAP
ncbi:cation:proton antiporter [Lysobacter korlensis]|uniref:Cation:proton antiporter n=1 Tax=Lysobacter korlensis TaxID=553636 RepID=A0ABV6S0P4_9GAMM